MKNIVLLTNIYPNNDPNYVGTSVCHAFTTEWVKLGYNVRVVHFDSLFPRPYYWVGRLFNSIIQAKTGAVAYTNTPRYPKQYKVDGVPVMFVPLRKYIPHKSPSQKQVNNAFAYLVKMLRQEEFEPNVVTAHFVLPQLQFLSLFKQEYPRVKTCLVLHGNSNALPYFYPRTYEKLMKSVDVWGFRSMAFQLDFEKKFGNNNKMFLCHSGIPEKYFVPINKNFVGGVKKFVFVGSLYQLKNVDISLRALKEAMGDTDYHFDIVGSGAESGSLHKIVEELEMQKNVTFHGKMNRDEAQSIMQDADCFVMVSTREAFGLVYVEAMAKGCIVIGTKGQGIDGIVKHGKNGFLCASRNVEELSNVIKNIVSLSPEALQRISASAISTANELTDKKVAIKYINAIINEY